MTIQECKEQVAKKFGYRDWSELFQEGIFVMTYMDEVCELYASEKVTLSHRWFEDERKRADKLQERVRELEASEDELCKKVEREQAETVRVHNWAETRIKELEEENKKIKSAIPTDEELTTEIIARFPNGNNRGVPIAKGAFIDAVLWIQKRLYELEKLKRG